MLDAVGVFQNLLGELDGNFGEVVETFGRIKIVSDDEEVLVTTFQLWNCLGPEMADCRTPSDLGHL